VPDQLAAHVRGVAVIPVDVLVVVVVVVVVMLLLLLLRGLYQGSYWWMMSRLVMSRVITSMGIPLRLECMASWTDITDEDGNYCEYQSAPSMTWHSANYAHNVVEKLLVSWFQVQFYR
jgi:hypothetical protein